MSDQATDTDIEETPPETPPEGGGEEETPPENLPMTEVERIAKANGWHSEGTMSAVEYLEQGMWKHRENNLLARLNDAEDQIHQWSSVVGEFITQQRQFTAAQQRANYDAAIAKAIEDEQPQQAAQLAEAKSQIQDPPAYQPPEPPSERRNAAAVQVWANARPWMRDPVMNEAAQGIYRSLVPTHGDNPETILPQIDAQMRQRFPNFDFDRMQAVNTNENRKAPDATSPQGRQRRGSGGLTRNDLDPDESRHFDSFVAVARKKGIKDPEKHVLQSIEQARASRR